LTLPESNKLARSKKDGGNPHANALQCLANAQRKRAAASALKSVDSAIMTS
jgi:hypothetical protein